MGLNILIDGEYALAKQGTGISTYARTLARALNTIGHQVSWLSGAPGGDSKDPVADAVAVADQTPIVRGPRAWAQTTHRMVGGMLSSKAAARAVLRSDVILEPSLAEANRPTHLAPDLFARAHYRHMLLRAFTEVTTNSKMDVLHLTAPLPISMRGVKSIITIHDLVPMRLPYTTPDNKNEFIARVRRCARDADLVVTASIAAKQDLVSLLDIDPEKVAITYHACSLDPLSEKERERLPPGLERFDLKFGEYILFVGAQEPKKNLKRLIAAYLDLDTRWPLVLAGPRGWMWESEVGSTLAPLGTKARARIRLIGYVERDDLRRLYAGAGLFAFPSLHEGFGLPALEAMNAGCPVLTTNTSSLPEVCGEAALYVDPFDRNDIRDKLEQILGDASLRESLATAGRARARQFSFENYVESLAAAYSRLRA